VSAAVLHPSTSLTEAYAAAFRGGMFDLSSPSPDNPPPVSYAPDGVDVRFSRPGGSLPLRRAIAHLYEQLGPDDVVVTNGASEALAALAAALAESRRPFAVARGMYPSFTEVAALAGVPLVPIDEATDAAALLITNPTVPDGRRVDLELMLSRARAIGAVPIVDEVYRHIALDGGAPPMAAADLDQRAVSIGDLSKSLGLGGLRIGWLATRNRAVRDAAARWLRVFTGGPSVLSEPAACQALDGFTQHVAQSTERAQQNAIAMYAALRSAGWQFAPAELGLTVCAYPPTPPTATQFGLLADAGLFLLGSEAFGLPGGFRVGLLTPPAVLIQALRILAPARHDRGAAIVVLTRVPRVGFGKSRLAATMGAPAAFSLASAFMRDTLGLLSSRPWQRVVAVTPAHAMAEVRALVDPATAVVAQAEGELGTRIVAALDQALCRAERAVLIGSDTPDLAPQTIERALAALHVADVVIGPATDGGFYLIGMRRTYPQMFAGVEWSTSTVCTRTVANLEALGLRVAVIETWHDVDDAASLAALSRRLEASQSHDLARATRAVLAGLAGAAVK
jgi:uncharacterized protein